MYGERNLYESKNGSSNETFFKKKKGTMLAISIGSSGINKSNVKHGSLPTQRVEKRVKVLTVKEIC